MQGFSFVSFALLREILATVYIMPFVLVTVGSTVESRKFLKYTVGLTLGDSLYHAFCFSDCRVDSRRQEISQIYCWVRSWPTVYIMLFEIFTVKVTENDSTETKKYYLYCHVKR